MNRKHFGCKVEGCMRIHESHGYCAIHANQIRKHGKLLTGTYSYKKSKNEIFEIRDYCIMYLYDKLGIKTGECLFDVEDREEIVKYKWYLNAIGYVYSGKGGYFHRFVLKLKKGERCEVDHKDGNKLDNRRSNIRKCSRTQNSLNKGKSVSNTSGYKGVHFLKRIKKWIAYIKAGKKIKYLGSFSSKTEAAIAYTKVVKKYHGEFAYSHPILYKRKRSLI